MLFEISSSSFNLHIVGKLLRDCLVRNGVQIKEENENSLSCVHVLLKTLSARSFYVIVLYRATKKGTAILELTVAAPSVFLIVSFCDVLILVLLVADNGPNSKGVMLTRTLKGNTFEGQSK